MRRELRVPVGHAHEAPVERVVVMDRKPPDEDESDLAPLANEPLETPLTRPETRDRDLVARGEINDGVARRGASTSAPERTCTDHPDARARYELLRSN